MFIRAFQSLRNQFLDRDHSRLLTPAAIAGVQRSVRSEWNAADLPGGIRITEYPTRAVLASR